MILLLFLLTMLCLYLGLNTLYLKCKVKHAETMQHIAEERKSAIIVLHNEVVQEANKLIKQNNQLKQQLLNNTTPVSNFTAHELRQLKFYLHPDKTSGKTHNLFIKINQLGNWMK